MKVILSLRALSHKIESNAASLGQNPPPTVICANFVLILGSLTDGWRSGGHDGASLAFSYCNLYPACTYYFYAMIYGPILAQISMYSFYALLLLLNLHHTIHAIRNGWLDFGWFTSHNFSLIVI